MELQINVKETRKKLWKRQDCDECVHRFTCYTSDVIYISPDKKTTHGLSFKLEYHTPRCIRIGLLKNLTSDGWYGGPSKYGELTNPSASYFSIVIKLPNIVRVHGRGNLEG